MSDIIVGPQHGTGFRIESVWVALVVSDDTDEAVPAVMSPSGAWTPLIAADPTRLEWIKDQARRMAKASNKPVRIVRMHARELVETFHPDGRRERAG